MILLLMHAEKDTMLRTDLFFPLFLSFFHPKLLQAHLLKRTKGCLFCTLARQAYEASN